MLFARTLAFILLFFLPSLSQSQVAVFGKLSIGDPQLISQLTTKRSDQFRGSIQAWTQDSIVITTTNKVRIAFPVKEVFSIVEVEIAKQEDVSTEIIELKTYNGLTFHGFPLKITNKKIVFEASRIGRIKFSPQEVISMKPETILFVSDRPFKNEYVYYGDEERVANGKLIAFQNGLITHRTEKGVDHQLEINGISKYKLKPLYTPYNGYGRSLVFVQTGFGMKPREKELRNIMVGLSIFSYGISEHISMATGLIGFIPYADIKISKSFGKLLHASIGGYGVIPFSVGIHGAVSIGTPDYFLNIGYYNNFEKEDYYFYNDFESFNVGASIRISKRSRAFAEYNVLAAPVAKGGGGYDSFWETGYSNAFTWGYGWFNPKFRFETGVIGTGPYPRWCFTTCEDPYYYVPIPFISVAFNFR